MELAKKSIYDIAYITCKFEKSDLKLKVVYNPAGKVAGFFILPPNADETSYTVPSYVRKDLFEEKSIKIMTDSISLSGILSMPKGSGPFPAIILVAGSGPNDMDESIGPNKPFRDLAWGLASQGIAVVRYNKRTNEHPHSFRSLKQFTVKEEVLDDALSALKFARNQPGIDPNRVYVLGHSLGGMLAPRIASLDTKTAGIVIMAGAVLPIEDKIIEQSEYIASVDPAQKQAIEQMMPKMREDLKTLKQMYADPKASLDSVVFGVPYSYWLDLHRYEPAKTAASLKCKIFVIQGERDYQVTIDDYKRWDSAIGGHANASLKKYPKLNHLFSEGEGKKSTPSEYQSEAHVAPYVIEDIANWILAGSH
jgi:dienelactone hydrolase